MNDRKKTEKETINFLSFSDYFSLTKKDFTKNNSLKMLFFPFKSQIIIIIIIMFFIFYSRYISKGNELKDIDDNFIIDKEFYKYERNFITESMKKYANWDQSYNEPYFINGIIRKFKPKNCLEIGVSKGGGSIIILNAIKDIEGSSLISLDLNEQLYYNNSEKTGCNVKKYFPELAENKWKLYTGKQPHIFLDKLNMKFDFLFLDTSHLAPGELINIIEALPFLKENAIVVLHDIMYHLPSHNYYNPPEVKYHPSMIYLMTSLKGKKYIMNDDLFQFENIGAIILSKNQEKYYLNYFLLLMSPWDYMLSDEHIEQFKSFLKKYYKKKLYLRIFNSAVRENKIYIQKSENLKNSIRIYESSSKNDNTKII